MKDRKIMKRIGAIMCALFMCVGVFGGAVPYYAQNIPFSVPIAESEVEEGEYEKIYSHYVIVESYGCFIMITTSSLECFDNKIGYSGLISKFVWRNSIWDRVGYGSGEGSINGIVFGCLSRFDVTPSPEDGTTSNFMNFRVVYSTKEVVDEDGNILCVEGFNNSYNDSSGDDYNSNIGYLQNITSTKAYLTNSFGVSDMDTASKRVYFAQTSTTGLDLLSGNYGIRMFSQMCYYKGDTSEIYDDDYPLIYINDFDIDDTLSITYVMKECLDMVNDGTESNVSWLETLFKRATRSDNVYLQIIDKDSGACGGYVKIAFYNNGDYSASYVTTVDENLEIDEDGYFNVEIEEKVGGGATFEDAFENAEPVGVNALAGVDSFVEVLNSLSSSFDNVVLAIGGFFECLPSWVLGVFGLSVALVFLLFVIKKV